MKALFSFLFESDLPVALQVFWKLLTLGMAALTVFVAAPASAPTGAVILYVFAAVFVLAGVFTKLGDG